MDKKLDDLMFKKHYKLTFFIVKIIALVCIPAYGLSYLIESQFDIAPWGKIISFAIAFPVIQIILVVKLKKYLNTITNDNK